MYWSYANIVAIIVTMSAAMCILGLIDYAKVSIAIVVFMSVTFRYIRMLML